MKKQHDPHDSGQQAAKLEAAAQKLRLQVKQVRDQQITTGAKLKAADVSPRTKLPVEHEESQAVERIHYEMQQSLCGRPPTEEELRELDESRKNQKKNQ